jgi:hypothetical protein
MSGDPFFDLIGHARETPRTVLSRPVQHRRGRSLLNDDAIIHEQDAIGHPSAFRLNPKGGRRLVGPFAQE